MTVEIRHQDGRVTEWNLITDTISSDDLSLLVPATNIVPFVL